MTAFRFLSYTQRPTFFGIEVVHSGFRNEAAPELGGAGLDAAARSAGP